MNKCILNLFASVSVHLKQVCLLECVYVYTLIIITNRELNLVMHRESQQSPHKARILNRNKMKTELLDAEIWHRSKHING